MLTDMHMFQFMKLIPQFNMQETIFLQNLFNIEPVRNNEIFIQILFCGSSEIGHWICVWYDGEILHVYDSLNGVLNDDHKKYLHCLLPNKINLKIVYEKVQIQKRTFNCGLFAIAFAISITKNICPCSIEFEETKMRDHLLKIFQTREIQMFPLSKNEIPNNLIIDEWNEVIVNDIPFYHYNEGRTEAINLKIYDIYLLHDISKYD